MSIFHSQSNRFLSNLHQVYKYYPVPYHSGDHTSFQLSQALAGHQIQTHDKTNTRRRTKIVSHKLGRKSSEMDVREVRTSLQYDTEDGFNHDGSEIPNFRKVFYKLKFVCAPRLQFRECSCHYKAKSTMEGAVVRPLVVSSGIVRVAWAPTPLGKETPQNIFRTEKG